MLALLRLFTFILFFSGLLLACSHSPKYSDSSSKTKVGTTKSGLNAENTVKEIANLAKSLLGSPYKYGGASPKGFDCSGLVYYTHGQLGIRTPRTSLQQYKSAKNIELNKLRSGDLVFFTLNKNNVSHVGIYVGRGRFIHAPMSGKLVAVNYLNDDFWRPRIVGGGRLH